MRSLCHVYFLLIGRNIYDNDLIDLFIKCNVKFVDGSNNRSIRRTQKKCHSHLLTHDKLSMVFNQSFVMYNGRSVNSHRLDFMLWSGIWTIFNIVSCKSITPITSLSSYVFFCCCFVNARARSPSDIQTFHLNKICTYNKVEDFIIDSLMITDDWRKMYNIKEWKCTSRGFFSSFLRKCIIIVFVRHRRFDSIF